MSEPESNSESREKAVLNDDLLADVISERGPKREYPENKVEVIIRYEIPTTLETRHQGESLRKYLLEHPEWARSYAKSVEIISVG